MPLQIDILVWRGSIPESRHRVQAAVVDRQGHRIEGTEHADLITTFRSAAKPFQLLPLVERGHADRWRLSQEELAVMAASHTGAESHVRLVRDLLARFGLGEGHLACGFHEPLDPGSLAYVRAHPQERSPLYNNCSGKHAGMLCLALSEGWPARGYEQPDHPVQRLMRATVAELCGLPPESLGVGVDGCGVSVFGLPLTGMARAYAHLAAAEPGGSARERALHRIRTAMSEHPKAVGGDGRFSTALMERTSGRMVAKGGAEGLECVGLPARGFGIAVKCEDGQARGLSAATVALLEHLGELSPEELDRLSASRRPVLHNDAGTEVGALEASVQVVSHTA
ncbi:MAG TPA: asparaginase [Candidatus Limnocylindria bacterium]|nr:asparaginase [Candidatus Limnocylindria bacterium]